MRATIRKLPSFLPDWPLYLAVLLVTLLYWAGLASVPFHPDESTQIFMSADFDTLFRQPGSLAWSPTPADPARQLYRLLDAPLTRVLIGAGRTLAGLPATPVDWNWSLTYAENAAAGALPDPALLLAGRAAVACLFPFSLLLCYWIGKRLKGRLLGWIFCVLLASNALVLLHTRRAMAESVLLFCVLLFTWWLLKVAANPWTLAFPAALAFNAKQSAAALALVGILAICISPQLRRRPRRLLLNLGLFALVFLVITTALNPFLWRNPINGIQAALEARQDLLTRQVEAMRIVAPETVLDSLPQRAVSLVGNLYLVPLSFAEIGNYRADTLSAEEQYLANPFNSIARDFLPGGILFTLSTCGFILGIVEWVRSRFHQAHLGWLILLSLLQTIAVLLAFQLPFQRYVIPVLPFTIFWTGYFLHALLGLFSRSLMIPSRA